MDGRLKFDPIVSYDGKGTFTLTGDAKDPSGISKIEISADINGVQRDLGTATLNPNGNFSFVDKVGAAAQSNIIATETKSNGDTIRQTADFALTADVTGQPYVAAEDVYNKKGELTNETFFKKNGEVLYKDTVHEHGNGTTAYTYSEGTYFDNKRYSSFTDVYSSDGQLLRTTYDNKGGAKFTDLDTPGQTVGSGHDETFNATGEGDTRFVFTPGYGQDTILGFKAAGSQHDKLDLPSSDFASIADVLRQTHNAGDGVVIHDATSGDTIRLAGVDKAELKAHKSDFSFHG